MYHLATKYCDKDSFLVLEIRRLGNPCYADRLVSLLSWKGGMILDHSLFHSFCLIMCISGPRMPGVSPQSIQQTEVSSIYLILSYYVLIGLFSLYSNRYYTNDIQSVVTRLGLYSNRLWALCLNSKDHRTLVQHLSLLPIPTLLLSPCQHL